MEVYFFPGDASLSVEIEWTVDDGSGDPDTGQIETLFTLPPGQWSFFHYQPNDGVKRFYRARHVSSFYDDGNWTDWTDGAAPVLLSGEGGDGNDPETKNRVFEFYYNTATLKPAVKQFDNVSARVIAKGHISGDAQNGDAVAFPQNFDNPPMVLLRGGILHEPRDKWGATGDGTETGVYDSAEPTYEDMAPLNLDVSGFDLRARLRQKSGSTAQTDTFGIGTLDAQGETLSVNLDNAPSADDSYVAEYDVTLNPLIPGSGKPPNNHEIIVAVDSNDGGGWVERATRTYNHVSLAGDPTDPILWTGEQVEVTVSGLDNTDDIRVRIKSVDIPGGATFDVDPVDVSYFTASDNFASKTPDVDDSIEWEAIEVS